MRLRCLAISLALLEAFASDSWGQSKQPSPKTGQQNSAQQERGTDNSPVVVKVIPTEKSKDDLAREIEKQESDRQLVKLTGDLAKYTWLLFVATGLLGLVTAGLVILGFRQVRDARRSIKAAEDSTRIAERALTELERPYIFIFGVGQVREDGDSHEFFVEYTVVNYGKMPAIIEGAWIDFVIDNKGEPPIPPLLYDGHSLLSSPILQSGERRENICAYAPLGMAKETLAVNINVKTGAETACPDFNIPDGFDVFFRATISYHGPSSKGHETGALWLFNPGSFEFAQRGGEEYNYTK
jgi:hypothetical protein